jgi:predicted DNA-binding transcriptional regulator AlpA
VKLQHRDEEGGLCRWCDSLAAAAGITQCRKRGQHVTAAELLRDTGALGEMCPEARRAAIRQLTVVAAAIAAQMDAEDDDQPVTSETDRLLDVDAAAAVTGLSVDQLYRRKNLPFRVQAGPGTVRFSVRGIERWIRAKTIRTAA